MKKRFATGGKLKYGLSGEKLKAPKAENCEWAGEFRDRA